MKKNQAKTTVTSEPNEKKINVTLLCYHYVFKYLYTFSLYFVFVIFIANKNVIWHQFTNVAVEAKKKELSLNVNLCLFVCTRKI